MQDGYISEDGTYETGTPSLFGAPVLVREGDVDFAEVVSGSVEKLAIYGRTHSEVWTDFVSQLTTTEALAQFGRGFISYPDDIRWFLYGVGAWANILGPEAKDRNTKTIQAVNAAVTGDGTPSGSLKRAVLLSAFLNHTVMRNFAGFVGRLAGGAVTTAFIQILMNRVGLSFLVPDRGVPKFFAFFPPLFLITCTGAVVRLAEKHFDKYGNLDNMGLTDILAAIATGQDEPDIGSSFMRLAGADLARRISSAVMSCGADIREANNVWFGEDSSNARNLHAEIRQLEADMSAASNDLRYARNDDEFYDALIRSHNIAIKSKRLGCRNEELEIFIILMDQTLLECLNMFIDSMVAVMESQTGNYEYWKVVEADKARMSLLNNTDYTRPEY
ncbi:hypothetical protein [Tritonibacter mobilis]|nr:hypothetical protein [Tritonibacter mobilis]